MNRKVPEVTVYFWITKVLTTAMGEATSDFLVRQLHPVVAVVLGTVALAAALIVQFAVPRYVPWIYWLTVVMVAVTGTMAADVLHVQFGVPYYISTPFFAVVLAFIFVVWQRTEKTLSIHSVTTRRREMFYWATVMATFALGTAAGDLSATTLHLGYLTSGLAFAALLAVPAVAFVVFRMNEVLTFWFAYVVTRPVGASFADWMGKPQPSGLGWGDGHVSVGLTVVIVGLVAFLSLRHHSTKEAETSTPST